MRYISFGPNKTKVSEVILGAMRIEGNTAREVADLIQTAVDCGINAVDMAPIYGPSESLMGQAFDVSPGLRDNVWLQTKLGIRHHPRVDANSFDFSYEHIIYEHIIESVDNSLKALNTDHIDSLLLHRPDALMEVGTTKPERVRMSAAACDWEMTREEWNEIYLAAGNRLP